MSNGKLKQVFIAAVYKGDVEKIERLKKKHTWLIVYELAIKK